MKAVLIGILLIGITFSSCDPAFSVEYFVSNKTDDDVDVKIYGLDDPYYGLIDYDTIIKESQSIKIYSYGHLGLYINPADTIVIVDSIKVVKNGIKAKKHFKLLSEWKYSAKNSYHIYQLDIDNSDF